MDVCIRTLLSSAQSYDGAEKNPPLQQAYAKLRSVAETRPTVDAPDPFGQDLFVQCAEIAFQYGLKDIARECVKFFFMRQQPTNQFLIRAYICHAQLLAPATAKNPEQLDKAVVFLLKAISLAKKSPRYHFLVYNASVIYWQFCRPFLKPNFRLFLAQSLHQVVKALDEIDDKDNEWRAQLMIALIECYLDAGQIGDASSIAVVGSTFIKQNVPSLYKQLFGLMVRYQLVEGAKLQKEMKNSPELTVFYKICKLKNSKDQEEARDYHADIVNILSQMGVAPVSNPVLQQQERMSRQTTKVVSGRVSPVSGEEFISGNTSRKSPGKSVRRTPTPPTTKKLTTDSCDRPFLLLDLAHLCMDLEYPDLASLCVHHLKSCTVKDQGFYLQLEFIQCMLMVKSLGENQESYQKSVVDVRLQAIRQCEEAVMNAIRFGDPNVIQAGCVTQWNLCLPLLQPNLRRQIYKPLLLVAQALEDIQSLLIKLRCQVHTELAKCEEDKEQIQVAMEHLKKALAFDDGNIYQERLQVMLRRLELRSQLYSQPERQEDQAAMIIEQAGKADSGTIRMKRSLLVKAGEALAPDAFLLVLDSESDTKEEAGGRGPVTVFKQFGGRARTFNYSVRKAEGHLKRLGNENDRERARLWGDLAKTARKQEVWDVCRVAARFCLLYDDGRWKSSPTKPETPKQIHSEKEVKDKGEEGMDLEKKPSSQQGSRSLTTSRVPLYDKDLIRMLAEVNFINGEAMIHLLRSQGVQLNDKPIPPEDKSKKPKGFVPKKPEDDPDWIEYCNWISELSKVSTDSFLRGLELGLELKESWLVCSAAAYIWNYNNHILSQNRHQEIVPSLTVVLDGLKKIGHAGETKMMVNICNALANGLLQPWLPVQSKDSEKQELSVTDKSEKKDVKGMKVSKFQKSPTVSISIDALPDIKKAIEICEYAMQVTSGDNPHDVVPIASRYPLLQTWVLAKQMAQQQISKALGTDDESNTEGQRPMTRAIVAMEMQKLSKNGIFEFKEMSSVSDLVQMVENCQWTDRFTELQLWTHLTLLAYENSQHSLVLTCSKKALRFAMSPTQTKHRKQDKHQYIVQQEMLSYASILLGQSLVDNMAGKNSVRREAMDAFFNSARFARNAENYEMVIAAVRHYWNAIVDLVSQPIERNLIREQLNILLDCITATFSKKKEEVLDKKKPAEDIKDANEDEEIKDAQEYKEQKALATTQQKPPTGMAGKQEEDLTLRAALYGVLFQSYADKGEWEKALQAMDQAISVMPRTKHRLLIFKHRVMVKAKLGQSIEMDMQKFKDESEDYVAQMWRRVALSSKELCEQLTAYQNAIESLANPANDFQKVEYLIEFGQWLYTNEFPLQDVLDQVEWAVDILLNMQEEKVGGKFSNVSMVESKANLKAKRAEKKISKVSTHGKISVDHLDRKSPSQDNRGKKFLSHHTTNISENEDNPEIIVNRVPTVRKITIGLLSSNLNQGIMDLTNVQQLDALIRCHVLLAELTGCDGSGYADTCVMAYSYLHRLWQVLMAECGYAMKEINKVQISPIDENGKGKGKGKDKEVKAPNKPKGKEKEAPVKEKPRRKGPLDSLPDSVEEWSVYDAPDEEHKVVRRITRTRTFPFLLSISLAHVQVIEAFQHEFMKKTGLNEETLPKPMLTMHYLDSLVRHLRELGYSHLALPVLAFEDVLSRSLLENKSLKILVHSRALEVCQELDLKNGCEFHRQIIGSASINQDDQAQSRKEIALWKEKQIQMAREEMRTKEGGQGDVLMEPGLEPEFFTPDTFKAATDIKKGDGNPTAAHLGKVLGAVSLRDVWTDTAEVLIRLGYLQLAREYLNEANMAAQTFSDKPLQSRILFLFGRLAFAEAQYGQAIKCCEAAQEMLEGDEMFWYETTMLMVDAYLDDYTNKKGRHIANMLLLHALNEFNMIVSDHPNRAATIGFITAMIETKTARIQLQDVLTQHKDINVPQAMKAFLAACGKLDGASQKLVRLGHRREAVPYVVEHAKSLVLLAQACIETSMQHAYYLEALVVMKEAEYLAKHVFLDVQSLITLFETRNISLPVERELASVLVSHGELLVMIGELHVNEMQCIQVNEKRKNSLLRTVEEFVRQTPVYAPVLQEWLDNREIVFEEAESLLVNAHNHAGSATDLKAKALLGLGKCMRILAEHKGPDVPSQWLIHEMEVLRLDALSRDNQHEERERGKEREKEEEEEEITDSGSVLQALTDEEIRLVAKQSKQMAAYIGQHDVSKLCFMYASECLTQALNCALTNKHKATAGLAALELVKCFGQYDASSATHFLAFYQSCQNSLHMEKLLSLAQRDPVTSTLAAVLRQRDFLMHNNHTTNLARSPVMEAVIQTLEKDWQAWKMLQVVPQHLELLKEFPSNFTFVILQHSPEKDFLYAAIMDKPRASSEKGVGGKMLVKQPPTSSKAKIFRTETSAGMLEKLVKKFQKHKQSVQALLLKQEYQRTQAAQRQKMLENLDEDIKPQTKVITGISDEANQLEEEFLELLAAMENYLRPVLSSMDTIFSSADGSGEKDLVDECVILLADPDLMELPLEALSFLQVDGITALSRDFSLQMMHHRMHVADTTEETTDKKKKTDSSMSISRIPGARETKSKPSGKAVPTHRSLLPWQVGIETGNIKYFVDAHWDCAETEDRKPIEQFTKILQEYEQQFTSHWLGIFGNDHEPSVGEWEIYLKESSAFIFYGFERFLSYIPPAKVSALNIPDCMVMYLLDLAQTNKSFVRQCKVDVSKSHDLSGNSKRLLAELRLGNLVIMIDSFICQPSFDVPLENPLEMAMLVTLTGTRCIMTNQWYCSLAENTDKLNLTMKDLLQRGKSTGQAVRLLFSPRKRRQEEQVTSALSEDKGKKDDTGSKKGGSSKKGDDSIRKDTSSKASLRPPGTGARPASAIGSVVEEIQKEAPDSAKDSEEAKEDSFGSPKSAWFNMVCYGLPNLVIT